MTSIDHRREPPGIAHVGEDIRAPRAAGVAGLVFAVLFVAAIVILRNHPGPDAAPTEVARWYLEGEARNIALVGLYLAPFAGIAFLWFIAVIRQHLGAREDRFFATVFLGSGLLWVAMLFAAAAAAGAPLAAVRFQGAPVPSPGSIDLMRGLAYTFLYVYGVRVAAVFVVSVSTLGLRTSSLPRWLAYAGYALALVMLLSVSFFRLVVLLFPAWVAAVSIAILLLPAVREGGLDPRAEGMHP